MNSHRTLPILLVILLVPAALSADPPGPPSKIIDVATLDTAVDPISRVHGAGVISIFPRLGSRGVPVAGGKDVDGDGFNDYGLAHMISSPLGRTLTGEANVVFGDGTIGGTLDLAVTQARVLRILGEGNLGKLEMTGTSMWIDDVTGDGIGDILLGRQNYSFDPGAGPRLGAGALTVVVGGPALRAFAATLQPLDLANPPASITLFHLLGARPFGRLGIWVRSGDLDGDGTADLVIGADQESDNGANHSGAAYVVRGGPHLDQSLTVDLAGFGATPLAGHLARITSPAGSAEFHLGATCALGDLDGNGRAEVLAAATLGRSSAALGPDFDNPGHVFGGPQGGRVYVVWDDNFPAGLWPAGLHIDLGAPTGSLTTIRGGPRDNRLGEEIVGGMDINADGHPELFLGDLGGDGSEAGDRPVSGIGYLLYRAERLRDEDFVIDDPPPGIHLTKMLGPNIFALGGDSATAGDFDGDGFDDLIFGAPTGNFEGRIEAGVAYVLYGQAGLWPPLIDTAPEAGFPPEGWIRITVIGGALGDNLPDVGDVLGYSATAGDIDHDGKADFLSNEMFGNGIPPTPADVGNLVILSGDFFSPGPVDGKNAGSE